MTFSSKLPNETPQSVWAELNNAGARILLTIPFGVPTDKMAGFISICGDKDSLPVLTMCVETPKQNKCIVSTIVYPSIREYETFVEKMLLDFSIEFGHKVLE